MTTTSAADFTNFLKTHVWVPILAGIVVLSIIVLVIVLCIRKRRYAGYTSLESGEGKYAKEGTVTLGRGSAASSAAMSGAGGAVAPASAAAASAGGAPSASVGSNASQYLARVEAAKAEAALMEAQYYCRSVPGFAVIRALADVGSRVNKHWFLVNVEGQRSEQLMMTSPRSANCVLPLDAATRGTLRLLLAALRHPYLFPVTGVDFIREKQIIVIVEPYSAAGSLKDLIYRCNPASTWDNKYARTAKGMRTKKIAVYGRQILEAMLFLRERGFPHGYYVHSGNVILDDGVARLTGYEGCLMGYTSRHYPLIKPMVGKSRSAIDAVAFGHLVYEMAMGAEMQTEAPSFSYLEGKCNELVLQVLQYIFVTCETGKVPTLEGILQKDLFARVALNTPVFEPPVLSSACRDLLKTVRRGGRKTSHSSSSSKSRSRSINGGAGPAIASTSASSSVTESSLPRTESDSLYATGGQTAASAASPIIAAHARIDTLSAASSASTPAASPASSRSPGYEGALALGDGAQQPAHADENDAPALAGAGGGGSAAGGGASPVPLAPPTPAPEPAPRRSGGSTSMSPR